MMLLCNLAPQFFIHICRVLNSDESHNLLSLNLLSFNVKFIQSLTQISSCENENPPHQTQFPVRPQSQHRVQNVERHPWGADEAEETQVGIGIWWQVLHWCGQGEAQESEVHGHGQQEGRSTRGLVYHALD